MLQEINEYERGWQRQTFPPLENMSGKKKKKNVYAHNLYEILYPMSGYYFVMAVEPVEISES